MEEEKHLALDKIIFDKEYPEVHRWLDELFPKYWGFRHWTERHHIEAIKEKYDESSDEYQVACMHVLADWMSHLKRMALPLDKQEVESNLQRWVKK